MAQARTSDDRPRSGVGFFSALICNISLAAIALAGARLTYESARADLYGYEISDSSLAGTRQAIEKAAAALPPEGADRRAFWGKQVQTALNKGDLDAAKGYLLLAPQMLPAEDGQALSAALSSTASRAEPANAADDRTIRAAVLLLPPAARAAWAEAHAEPDPLTQFLTAGANLFGIASLIDGDKEDEPDPFALDTPEVLAERARGWLAGEPIDSFRFLLSGYAQTLAGAKAVDKGDAAAVRSGVEALFGARRVRHLQPEFETLLLTRARAALPEDKLQPALRTGLAAAAPADAVATAAAIDKAFEQAANPAACDTLTATLKSVRAVSNSISPQGAATLLKLVRDDTDLKKLQLLAQAGGPRVLALSESQGPRTLALAQGALRSNTAVNGASSALALAGAALILVFGFTLIQAMGRFLGKRSRARLRLA